MSISLPVPRSELIEGLDAPLGVLDPEGSRRASPLLDESIGDVDESVLTDLYVDMSVVRRVDEEAFALTRQGALVLWPPLRGQEAAQVGALRALRDEDFVFPSYREHALAVLRGADLADVLAVWKGAALSGWDPFAQRLAPSQIIIGAQTLHATGYAMAARRDGGDDIALACFGDGATSEGDVNEAMVFAASFRAPVVFLCQNNQYAISEPVGVQSRTPLALRATGFGIPALRVDGNDVLAVLAAVRIAAERARTGGGPTFVEAVTYRMGPHTTTDDPGRYRDDAEVAAWHAKDPIDRLERHLARIGAPVDRIREEAAIRCDAIAAQVRAAADRIAAPAPESMFDHVYVEPTRRLERQRAQHRAFTASVEGLR
ncbi:pyruvate dehydrogenase (acetyl-transferring) E1 component subunit alpha [Microbacterium sp. MEC084]|uniref:thiamine pyrophosphate-dependent enzyme n=1 Tax=Microbacterium sp. MEC084 TaxID=1963027 RepID=UPI00107018B9|nr:thiamine pyrophosphate-dependent enzyme [Microbacterium sp. MEC084]MCD1268514.1 pyruvate dehydrogenase (acetyl-transferring) E1 component subunit alpha [Microbacterium sp. MEC084]